MPIRYTGGASLQAVDLILFGDGQSTLVMVNLTKAPFNLTFNNFFPTELGIGVPMGQEPLSVQIVQSSTLRIEYAQPLPDTDYVTGTPRNKLNVTLFYG